MQRVYIYSGFERFWHWTQAILIFFLMFTGFEVHGSFKFFGFENAVMFHIYAAYSFMALMVFAMFWHFTTGEWKQYIPTVHKIKCYIRFYLTGIFENAPHPTKRTILSKLNPLQRVVYFSLKVVMIPLLVITGILYLYYRFPIEGGVASVDAVNLSTIAALHTFGAYLLISFTIGHLYLVTTGHTIFSNINAMLTGYEELEMDNEHIRADILEKYKCPEEDK